SIMKKLIKKTARRLIESFLSKQGYRLQPTNFMHWPTEDKEFQEVCELQSHFGWSGSVGPKFERMYVVKELLQLCRKVDGNIAECGVFKGATSLIISEYVQRYGLKSNDKKIILYDSFEGLSEPSAEDDGTVFTCNDYEGSLEEVKNNLANYSDIVYRKGWIPTCFEMDQGESFSFVHIDVDFYEPVKAALEFFFPRVLAGGFLVLDDYGSVETPGARTACDQFCAEHHVPLVKLPNGQAYIHKANE
ncbi:TylF/MycF family methyltransferase, partial [bacterium]|nr:TylF/MycF family methyltransferase [bacterium]